MNAITDYHWNINLFLCMYLMGKMKVTFPKQVYIANVTMVYGTTLPPWKISFNISHLAYIWGLQSGISWKLLISPNFSTVIISDSTTHIKLNVILLRKGSYTVPREMQSRFFFGQILKNTSLVSFLIPGKKTRWESFCCCFVLIWHKCSISPVNRFTDEREQNFAIISMQKYIQWGIPSRNKGLEG